MPDQILIPTADAIIGSALDKMYEVRPSIFPHMNGKGGVYWHPVVGFRAQASLALEKLSDRAAARRLRTAEGKELLDYVASEFNAVPYTGQAFAVGSLLLQRTDTELPMPRGDYPKGTRITRNAVTVAGITYPAAEYETIADVHIPADTNDNFLMPFRATRSGAHANHTETDAATAPIYAAIKIPSLVPNIEFNSFQAGGGSDGIDDDYVRLYAKLSARGQFGPTSDASKLGALGALGVRHFLVYDLVETGSQVILIADSSWGSSSRWCGVVKQAIYDSGLVGFGCKVFVGGVSNTTISVTAQIALRDPNYLSDTSEIDAAVRTAARAYFDDRLDWNLWNKSALQSAISVAHPKILSCRSVTVPAVSILDFEIQEKFEADLTQAQPHLYLGTNAMNLSYVGPA